MRCWLCVRTWLSSYRLLGGGGGRTRIHLTAQPRILNTKPRLQSWSLSEYSKTGRREICSCVDSRSTQNGNRFLVHLGHTRPWKIKVWCSLFAKVGIGNYRQHRSLNINAVEVSNFRLYLNCLLLTSCGPHVVQNVPASCGNRHVSQQPATGPCPKSDESTGYPFTSFFLIIIVMIYYLCLGPPSAPLLSDFIIISNLSYDRSTASSKTIPPLNAI
jgi:hypothetical protein